MIETVAFLIVLLLFFFLFYMCHLNSTCDSICKSYIPPNIIKHLLIATVDISLSNSLYAADIHAINTQFGCRVLRTLAKTGYFLSVILIGIFEDF